MTVLATVGVVIVTFESQSTIGATLEALPLDRLGSVVVVDNASSDGTVAVVRGFTGVKVVENEVNLGFGAACNQGRELLGSEPSHLLFLNPDAVITAESLGLLLSALITTPRFGLVAPRLFKQGDPITSAGTCATFATECRRAVLPAIARHLPDRRYSPDHSKSGEVGYVEGACMLFRAAAFDAIGGFDPAFFLFYEELDVAARLRAEGWAVGLVAEARAEHRVASSRRALADAGNEAMWRSSVVYMRKWMGFSAVAAYRTLGTLLSIERIARRKWSTSEARVVLRGLWT